MPKRQTSTRFLVDAHGLDKHTIYWLGSGELVLASHREQTFAQLMATWDLMGRPDDTPCQCFQFVRKFRYTLSPGGGLYTASFRELQRMVTGCPANILSLGARTEATSNLRGYRGHSQHLQPDPLMKDRRPSLMERARARKRERFQAHMRALVMDSDIALDWGDDESALGPVYTEPSIRGAKHGTPQLMLKVNANAWDLMRRGWNRVADPDSNLMAGAKLVKLPKSLVPALCFKLIVKTDKPGLRRFRVGYRYMTLEQDGNGLAEHWHPFHLLRPIADLNNDRY